MIIDQSLSVILYKMLTKVLDNRFRNLVPLIISKEQIGFILGRPIFSGVIIDQEGIHSSQRNQKSSMV